jgi:protein TonB
MHAVQRVDTFGPLPAGYNESTLNVLYHCTYPGAK